MAISVAIMDTIERSATLPSAMAIAEIVVMSWILLNFQLGAESFF